MKNYLTIMSVCLLAVSCGAAKKVSQEKTALTTDVAVDSTSLRRQVEILVREAVASSSDMEREEDLTVVTEVFDAPDSSGVAPCRKRTTARYTSRARGRNDTSISTDSSVQSDESRHNTAVSLATSDINESMQTDETPRKMPGIVRILAWLGGIAFIFLVVWILRKFRVI